MNRSRVGLRQKRHLLLSVAGHVVFTAWGCHDGSKETGLADVHQRMCVHSLVVSLFILKTVLQKSLSGLYALAILCAVKFGVSLAYWAQHANRYLGLCFLSSAAHLAHCGLMVRELSPAFGGEHFVHDTEAGETLLQVEKHVLKELKEILTACFAEGVFTWQKEQLQQGAPSGGVAQTAYVLFAVALLFELSGARAESGAVAYAVGAGWVSGFCLRRGWELAQLHAEGRAGIADVSNRMREWWLCLSLAVACGLFCMQGWRRMSEKVSLPVTGKRRVALER